MSNQGEIVGPSCDQLIADLSSYADTFSRPGYAHGVRTKDESAGASVIFSEATRDFLDKVSKLNHLFASHAAEHGWDDDCPHTICERIGHILEEVRSEQSLFRLCVLLHMNLRSAGCWGTDSQLLSLLESDYLREILHRIHELSNERIRGGKCELILAFRDIGSRAPQRTGDHILRAIASALEKNQ